MGKTLRIAIGVGGRFHSERMMGAFLRAGHEAYLYSILPKFCFKDLPPERVRTFVVPEALHRMGKKLHFENQADLWKIVLTGKGMAKFVESFKEPFDYLFSWSSFGLEAFQTGRIKNKVVIRDSAHILEQMEISQEEYLKHGFKLPNRDLCIERELREYELADTIIVCSDYVKETFIKRGVSPKKLFTLPLGVDTSLFKAKSDYSVSLPLKVVYFGNISLNKGLFYLLEATKHFSPKELELTLIGSIAPEMETILKRYHHFKWQSPLPHQALSAAIQKKHVFVTPSLQDGFGLVIPQAMASGLVSIVTNQCGAKDLIENGKTGFVIPSKDVEGLKGVLTKLLNNPKLVETIGREAAESRNNLSWKNYEEKLTKWLNRSPVSTNPSELKSQVSLSQ